METKTNLRNCIKGPAKVILLIGAMALMSCSQKLCHAYAGSTARPGNFEYSYGSRNIPSPYTEKHKNHLFNEYAKKNKGKFYVGQK